MQAQHPAVRANQMRRRQISHTRHSPSTDHANPLPAKAVQARPGEQSLAVIGLIKPTRDADAHPTDTMTATR
jgi:hypothetical protein